MKRTNIVLIGMPGSGKSTIGIVLAKMSARDFLDTDVLIQTGTGRSLQSILEDEGHLALRDIEEAVLNSLNVQDHVISTGGSAVYSKKAIQHLKQSSVVVYLDVNLDTLEHRITNFDSRGIAKRPEQSFAELYEERVELYRESADVTIATENLNQEQICEEILAQLAEEESVAV